MLGIYLRKFNYIDRYQPVIWRQLSFETADLFLFGQEVNLLLFTGPLPNIVRKDLEQSLTGEIDVFETSLYISGYPLWRGHLDALLVSGKAWLPEA